MSDKSQLNNYSFGIIFFIKNNYNKYFYKMIKPLALISSISIGGYILHKYKYKHSLCPFLYFNNNTKDTRAKTEEESDTTQ